MNDNHLLGDGDGATPLNDDEMAGLIPSWPTTRGDLNAVEGSSIAIARQQVMRRRLTPADVLDEGFLRDLHENMFEEVWDWAGTYRSSDKNIGVNKEMIVQEIAVLIEDCRYWVEHDTYGPDELAVRFHHRLVKTRSAEV